MEQILALAGALLILAAYAGNQYGLLDRRDVLYNAMNLVGAVILTAVAYRARLWGFVLLEGVWSILTIVPLVRSTAARLSA
ncbi:MAG: CBU_0592 family membrane protein [Candidatus Rokuibacteriota bacterium]